MKNNKVAAKQAKSVRQMVDHKAASSDLQFTMKKYVRFFLQWSMVMMNEV